MLLRTHVFAAGLAVLLATVPTVAHSAAVRWNNAAGGNWNTAANWAPATVPTSADTAVIDLNGTYTVTMNVNVTLAGLRLSGSTSGTPTLSAASRTIALSGPATVGAQGLFTLSSCTVSGAGGITNEGVLTLINSTVANPVTNSNTLLVNGTTALNGAYTSNPASVLRIQGTAAVNTACTIANGFTNNGTLELTSTGAATAATLAVTAGTLVNASGAVMQSVLGAGGARGLHARIDNQGTLLVQQALSTNKASVAHVNTGTIDVTGGDYTVVISGTTPSWTTSGTVNVGSGRTLTLQGGVAGGAGQLYNYDGGTLGGAGTVQLTNSTLVLNAALATGMARLGGSGSIVNGPQTLTVSAGTTIPMSSSTINAPTVIESGGTLQMTNSDQPGSLVNGGVIEWIGTSTSSGTITTQAGSVFRVLGTAAVNSVVTVAAGFTNTATIELTATGAATAATMNVTAGTLSNTAPGVIRSLVGSGGGRNLNAAIHNTGTISVAQNLTVNKASVAHVNQGLIELTTGNLTIVISGTSPNLLTSNTINVAAGRTLTLQGGVAGGAGQNFRYGGGTLGGAGTVQLTNSTLVLEAPLSTGMAHLSGTGSIVNGQQTLTVSAGTTIPMSSCTINAPTVIDAGGTLQMTNSDQPGSLVNGGVIEWIGTSTSSGNVTTQAGSVFRVLGTAAVNSVVTVAAGFTNTATIELTATGAATAATMNVTAGTLSNTAPGVIQSLVGSGGGRNLNAAIHNTGTISVAQNLTVNKASVAHVNQGLIELTTGNLTIVISGTSPSLLTSNTINVAAGRTLTLQGGVAGGAGQNFRYGGGTLGGAGTVQLTNSTLVLEAPLSTGMAHLSGTSAIVNGPDTLTVSAGAAIPMSSCALNAPTVIEEGGTLQLTNSDDNGFVRNSGTIEWIGTSTSSGNITTQAGSVFRVTGTAAVNSVVTVAAGFTNTATIELTATGAATAATMTVTAGTLVNAPSGVIQSLVGTNGSRALNAQIDNQGTITVARALTTNKASADHVNTGTIELTGGDYTVVISGTTPSWTTSGTVNVGSGRTLTLQGGVAGGAGQLYNYNGGTLGGAGTVQLTNSTLVLNAALATGMAHLSGTSSIVNGPQTLTVSAGATIPMSSCTINAPTVIDVGGTLQMTNSDQPGSLVNGGVIEWIGTSTSSGNITTQAGSVFRVTGTAAVNSVVTVAAGFTNTATIELTATGAATAATMTVTAGTLVNAPSGVIQSLVGTNGSRALNAQIDNQGTITVARALTTNKASADHVNTGTIELTGGDYTVVISGTTPSWTTSGTVNVGSGRTLTLQGGVAGGAGQLYNYNGGTLGGAGTVQLTNSTLVLNTRLATSVTHLSGTSSIVNGPDTLTISAGGTTAMSNSTINATTAVDSGGTLQMTNSDHLGTLANRGVVEWIGVCATSGNLTLPAGSTTRVLGTAALNSALTSATGFTNGGTFELTSTGAATTATLTVTAGSLLNGPGGTLRSLVGAGGARSLLAAFANQGLADFQQTTTLNKAAAAHANAGTFRMAATKTVTVTGASFTNQPGGVLSGSGTVTFAGATAFAQAGTVRPGLSPGALTINGPLPCVSSSVLDVEIGGDDPGTGYDQVAVRDPAALAGALNVSVVNGYTPQAGRRYFVARFPSRTGTFASTTGLAYGPGQLWMVEYSDTAVALIAMDQTWTRVFPDGAPPEARDGHAAVYDSSGDRMIVFGGRSDAGPLNDVWVLSKAAGAYYPAWAPLAPSGTPPAPRTNASAAYDPVTNRLIVYGGDDGAPVSAAAFADAWVLTNANGTGGTPAWIPLAAAAPPPARTAHGAAYDPATNRLIVFGGNATPDACGVLADTWVLEHANGLGGAPAWTALAPAGPAPSARQFHGAAYDAASGRLIVAGGDSCGVPNTSVWVLDGANGLGGTPAWSALSPAQAAPAGWSFARYLHDPALQWLDAFGGQFAGTYVDTAYTLTGADGLSGGSWYRRGYYGNRPPARALHSMVLAPATHVAIVFGGQSARGRLSDVWRRELNQGRVLDSEPAPPPGGKRVTAFARPPSPNPAWGDVAMAVDVAREQRVELGVFDVNGRRVATLHSGTLPAGRHAFHWGAGRAVAPGVYLVRLKADDREQVMRIVRLR